MRHQGTILHQTGFKELCRVPSDACTYPRPCTTLPNNYGWRGSGVRRFLATPLACRCVTLTHISLCMHDGGVLRGREFALEVFVLPVYFSRAARPAAASYCNFSRSSGAFLYTDSGRTTGEVGAVAAFGGFPSAVPLPPHPPTSPPAPLAVGSSTRGVFDGLFTWGCSLVCCRCGCACAPLYMSETGEANVDVPASIWVQVCRVPLVPAPPCGALEGGHASQKCFGPWSPQVPNASRDTTLARCSATPLQGIATSRQQWLVAGR